MGILTCESCGLYKNPEEQLVYPNATGRKAWVKCGIGSIINQTTMGCGAHTERPKDDEPQKRSLVHTPAAPQGMKQRRVIL